MKRLIAIPVLAMLAGCTQTFYYDRASGLRVDANPSLLATFQRAKVECNGEVAQSRLAGSGQRAPIEEMALSESAMYGCMSKRGYDVRP